MLLRSEEVMKKLLEKHAFYSLADRGSAPGCFHTETSARLDGISIAITVIDEMTKGKPFTIEPLGQLHGAQIPVVVHYKIDEIISVLNALLRGKS